MKLHYPILAWTVILFSCSSHNAPNEEENSGINKEIEIRVLDRSVETHDTLLTLKTKYLLSNPFNKPIYAFRADYICSDSGGKNVHSGSIKCTRLLEPGVSIEYRGEEWIAHKLLSVQDSLILTSPVEKLNYTFTVTEVDTVNKPQ